MTSDLVPRRTVLVSLGAIGAAAAACRTEMPPPAAASPPAQFEATRHPEDDWLDAVPGKHRTFIDASTASGAGEAMLYANNLYVANQSGYSLPESDITVVVCLRHFATAFAFNDAIWAKYGSLMSSMLNFTDPKTKNAPGTNLLNSDDYAMQLPNLGNTIDSVVKRGTRFAVCDMATHFFAGQVAMATSGDADAIYQELAGNLIPSSHMVPAGVVAVNRAQERGYTLLTTL
jgi:hypothetical protein